jgi:threonine dehydrogenase-like Zn-dependent dehydrogenase
MNNNIQGKVIITDSTEPAGGKSLCAQQSCSGPVRIENVPDARIIEPTDAVVTVTRACICGSDLWPYQKMEHSDTGRLMGHEAIGIVDAVGADVHTIKAGDLVIMPFLSASGPNNRCTRQLALPGGAVGRVGVPQEQTIPGAEPAFYNNVMVGGGPAPVRAYIHELLPDVLEGRIAPGRVFDRTVSLDQVPGGYQAMNEREAIKVIVKP